MIFTSQIFFVFLAIVLPVHWLLCSRSLRAQNLFLLLASYIFYGHWDARFVLLMAATSAADFVFALRIADSAGRWRRCWLVASLISNFGVLAFFKYYNFFLDSLPFKVLPPWNILLPVGISFYTFQAVSYTVDVYRGAEPCRQLEQFLVYVAFFPHLVAGPIQRASELLVQFQQRRRLAPDDVSQGIRLMLWGFFKKLVVGDNCALLVDRAFADPSLAGPTLWIGLFFFSMQIYGDFSGYSDIAVGVARLFGVRLGLNFRYPYLSRGFREFWQRWHISLSTWFRDYVYLPLGGNRKGLARNVLVTFLLSGLWHGANWTFVCWGGLHGLLYLILPLRPRGPIRLRDLPVQAATFAAVTVLWVFFRSPSLGEAFSYLSRALAPGSRAPNWSTETLVCAGVGIAIAMGVEWLARHKDHPCEGLEQWPTLIRHSGYLALLLMIYLLGNLQAGYDFIYFQF